jgi:hypothetical protein
MIIFSIGFYKFKKMNLTKLEIRYYPPGLNIIYEEKGKRNSSELNIYSLANNHSE